MFLKYIVFFIFCFNISAPKAAEVIYDFADNEQEIEVLNTSGRLDLPHASRVREILESKDNSPIGRIIFIGKYFDEKYPGELINSDFSPDIAAIFPELSQQEIYDRTKFIRQAVSVYRTGMQKYTEIKETLLAPEEPPLIVDEKDYDLPGQHTYIEAPEGQVAVIYDFKKVLSYGSNPRDLKAMEAYRQRQLDNKENKTAFDKFKSMVGKLEFSKLPFYGISLPNPFVGNAGIGKWQEQDGFKVRMISDMAEISNQKNFLAALHVSVPGHRFMLATPLDNGISKPEIELIESENVESYQVCYPLPVKVADNTMIGAYARDFAFPIALTTVDPHQGIRLKAKITFQSCDYDLNCKKMEFFPEVVIEKAPENAVSSVMNFVKQSYYNLPKKQNKNLKLKQIGTVLSEDGNRLEKILFTFDFSGSINNFSLFLEDELNTRFQTPKIAVNGSEIHVTVTPENNQDLLPGEKAVLTVRLNAYTSLRQNIRLADFNKAAVDGTQAVFHFILFGLLAGILFNFMPISLPLRLLTMVKKLNKTPSLSCFSLTTAGTFAGCNLFALLLVFYQEQNIPFIWGMQYGNFFYLMAVVLLLTAILVSGKYNLQLLKDNSQFKAAVAGFLLTLLLPFSFTPFLAENITTLLSAGKDDIFLFFNMLAAGISVFELLSFYLPKTNLSGKTAANLQKLLILISYFLLAGMIVWLLFMMFLQVRLPVFLKAAAMLAVFAFICTYVFSFLQALYQTRLPKAQKNAAEKVVIGIFTILSGLIVWFSAGNIPDNHNSSVLPENMNERLIKGDIILTGIVADWCPLCRFNDFTALNKRNLERWNRLYRFEYIPVDIRSNPQKSAELLRRYNFVRPPLYILYSYNFEEGLVLSPLLVDSKLEQIIEDAGF